MSRKRHDRRRHERRHRPPFPGAAAELQRRQATAAEADAHEEAPAVAVRVFSELLGRPFGAVLVHGLLRVEGLYLRARLLAARLSRRGA